MPLSEPARSKWIEQIEKVQPFDYTIAMYPICSRHFHLEDMNISGKRKTIKSEKYPTIFESNHSNIVSQIEVNQSGASGNENMESSSWFVLYLFKPI